MTSKLLLKYDISLVTLFCFIIDNIVNINFAILTSGLTCVGATAWVFSTLYLKYKFIEINEKIELSLKQSNINLLMYAINEHEFCGNTDQEV